MGFLDRVLSGLSASLLLAPRDQVQYGVNEAAALSGHSIPVGSQGGGIMLSVLQGTQSWLKFESAWGRCASSMQLVSHGRLYAFSHALASAYLQLAPSPAGASARALHHWKAMLPGQDSNIAESWHWEACSRVPS